MNIQQIDDCYIDCYEIHQLCIIFNEYLELYIDKTVIADRAGTFAKVIEKRIENLKDKLDELSEQQHNKKYSCQNN